MTQLLVISWSNTTSTLDAQTGSWLLTMTTQHPQLHWPPPTS